MRETFSRPAPVSLIRTRPRPSEPKSGLTTTSPPSASKAASASVAPCPAQVGGTGKAAASSNASVRYLSTAASTARGGLRTGTPAAATRCKASIRKTTCSRLPGGIIRTRTPSAAVRSSSPADHASRARCAADDGRDPRKRHRLQRHTQSPAARSRSSTCQPKPETRAISDVIDQISHSRFEDSRLPTPEQAQVANERAKTSGLTSPKVCIAPVSTFWKTTSAGLNR